MIVQADGLSSGVPQVVLALMTTNLTRAGHPSRVLLVADSPEGREAGVISDTVVVTDNLATVRLELIDRAIGRVVDLTTVNHALKHTLGLD